MRKVRLTSAQARVLELLKAGKTAGPGNGSAVQIDGARVCNTDTMATLERLKLVIRNPEDRTWKATKAGLTFGCEQ